MKSIKLLITLLAILSFLLPKSNIFAEGQNFVFIYSPDSNQNTILYTYKAPFSQDPQPISQYIGYFNQLKGKIITQTPSYTLPQPIFIFQDMNNNQEYLPNDPSLFVPDAKLTDFEQYILTTTKTDNITFNISKEDDDSILVTVNNTDNSINFNKYKDYLEVAIIDDNSNYSTTPTLQNCSEYLCSSISGVFKNTPQGKYDIAVKYGPEDIAYIKSAVQILRPTPSMSYMTQSTLLKQNIITPSKTIISQTTTPTISTTTEKTTQNRTRLTITSQRKTQLSIFSRLIGYLKDIINELRERI